MKRPAFRFLQYVGKAVLNVLGGGVLGDLLAEVLPEVAKKAWEGWGKDTTEEQRRQELEALAQAPAEQVRGEVERVVNEVAADQPAEVREAVKSYLIQVPASLRQTFRRPADPSGKTIPPAVTLRAPEDLLAVLPGQMPQFKPGDRPLPGVDLELVELLGVGGFGEVWKARNPHVAGMPHAALKFCLSAAARERLLLHEAKVLAQVMRHGKHPGIVQLQNTYFNSDPPCLQYEYVPGGDLAGLIRDLHARPAPPSPRKVAEILLALCEIVGYAHHLEPAIVHRDLKPANILIQKTPQGVRFKIADFGIGGLSATQTLRATGKPGTTKRNQMTTALRGSHTPLYASPQQAAGHDPDPRDDVFSLGVIWYQLLIGDLAAGRPGGTRWTQRLLEGGVSPAQVELLASCFEDAPDDRPADAGVLASRLKETLAEHPRPTAAEDSEEEEEEEPDEPEEEVREVRKAKRPEKPTRSSPPRAGKPSVPLIAGVGAGVLVLVLIIVLSSRKPAAPPEPPPPSPEAIQADRIRAAVAKGNTALNVTDLDAAIKAFSEVIELESAHEEARLGRAKAHNGKKQYDQALADAGRAVEINPKNAQALEQRAIAAYHKGDLARVAADVTEAFRLAPPPEPFANVGSRGQPGMASAPAIAPVEKPVVLYQYRAISYCWQGKYAEALQDCDAGLARDGNHAELTNLKGIAQANQGDHDSAIRSYDAALSLKSDFDAALFNKALALGGFSRKHDRTVSERAANWGLSAQLAWAYPDLGKLPTVKNEPLPKRGVSFGGGGAPRGPGGGFGPPFGGPGNPGGLGAGVPFNPGNETVLPVPLPGLPAPALGNLWPAPLQGPPLPLLALPVANSGPFGPPGGGNDRGGDFIACHGSKADFAKAAELFQQVLDRSPGFGPVLFNLGWAHYKLGNHAQALRFFSQLAKQEPQSALAHYYTGLAHLARREAAPASKSFTEALRLDGRYAWAYKDRALARTLLGEHAEASQDLKTAWELASLPAVAFNAGLACLEQGQFDEARTWVDFVIRSENKFVAAYLVRALASLGKEDHDQALNALNDALAIQSNDAATLVLRGRVHEAKRQFTEAQADYERAAQLAGESAPVLVARAFFLSMKPDATAQEIDTSIGDYTRAMDKGTSDPALVLYRALAYHRKGALEEAERACTQVLRQNKDQHATASVLRGLTYLAGRRTREAEDDFKKVIEDHIKAVEDDASVKPTRDFALAYLWRVDLLANAAKGEMRPELLKVARDKAQGFHVRGTLWLRQRVFPTAESDLKKAIEAEPRNPAHHYKLAVIHSALGRTESAKADLKSALDLSAPGSPYALHP